MPKTKTQPKPSEQVPPPPEPNVQPRRDRGEATPVGALVKPDGMEAITISEREYKSLEAFLGVMRTDNGPAAEVLEKISIIRGFGNRPFDMRDIVFWLIDWHQQKAPDTTEFIEAILSNGHNLLTIGTEEEFERLSACLKVLQSESWFAEFIACNCKSFVGGEELTPLLVMKGLTLHLSEFRERLETAKSLAEQYPGAFKAAQAGPKPT